MAASRLGLLGQGPAAALGQVGQQLGAGAAPQLKQHEGIFREAITHQIEDRTDVLAGIGLIGAAALAAYLLQLERKQALAAGGEGAFNVGGHHPSQQLG